MIKRFIYYGLALILIAVIIFLSSGYLIGNGISRNILTANLTAGQHSFAYLPINPNSSSATLGIYAVMDNFTNVYIMNVSAFSAWSAYIESHRNSSGAVYASGLKINSSYTFINKSSVAALVLPHNFPSRNSTKDAIYVVIDNTAGSRSANRAVSAVVSYLPLQSSALEGYALANLATFIIFIAGIITIIYGAVKKGSLQAAPGKAASESEKKDQAYVNQLYKGLGGKRKKNKRGS